MAADRPEASQVICITHLAQIASMADTHFCIEKKLVGQEAKTFIRRLSDEESIEELAKDPWRSGDHEDRSSERPGNERIGSLYKKILVWMEQIFTY